MPAYVSIAEVPGLPNREGGVVKFGTRHYDIRIERIGTDRWSVRTEPDSGLDGELVRDGDTYDLLIESNRWLSRCGFATWEEAVQIIF